MKNLDLAQSMTDLVSKLDDEISQKVIEYITGLLMDYTVRQS